MASPQRELATYADILELPEDARAEVLGGDVVLSPAPLPRHSHAQGSARRFIGGPFHDDDGRGGPGGWWIFVEVDVPLGPNDIVRPDLARSTKQHAPEELATFLNAHGAEIWALHQDGVGADFISRVPAMAAENAAACAHALCQPRRGRSRHDPHHARSG